MEPRLNAQS